MKIPTAHNLIRTYQPYRDAYPTEPSFRGQPQVGRQASDTRDGLGQEEPPLRYYIDDRIENRLYSAQKTIVDQRRPLRGTLVDLYV